MITIRLKVATVTGRQDTSLLPKDIFRPSGAGRLRLGVPFPGTAPSHVFGLFNRPLGDAEFEY